MLPVWVLGADNDSRGLGSCMWEAYDMPGIGESMSVSCCGFCSHSGALAMDALWKYKELSQPFYTSLVASALSGVPTVITHAAH